MQLEIVSWNGSTDINNDTTFDAWIEQGQLRSPERDAVYSERSRLWQKLSTAKYGTQDITFRIRCLGTVHSQRETIRGYFSMEDFTPHTLVLQDTADSNRQWYLTALPLRVVEEKPGIMAVTLAVDEPYLRTVVDSTGTWSITATGQTTDITVQGNITSRPRITVTPTSAKAGNYSYSRWIPIYNKTATTFSNYPLDVGGIDTAALVAANKVQSAGQDLRVRVNGADADRWFAESSDARKMNTTDTAIWTNVSLPPKISLTIASAIASTDTVTTIVFANTAANISAVKLLAAVYNKVLLIEDEAYTFTAVNTSQRSVTGVSRAAKGTSAATHSAGTAAIHIPQDMYLVYGSSDAAAQTVDDGKKPLISPDSTNTLWVYYNYFDSTSPSRSGRWSPAVNSGNLGGLSGHYTATQNTVGNPASVMGMRISSYQSGVWKPETASVSWTLDQPAGVSTVQATASKYRYSTGWPALTGLQYFNIGTNSWITVDTQATPSSDQTWTAATIASTDTGNLGATRYKLRVILSGTVNGIANNFAAFELDPVTLQVDTNGVPFSTAGAEVASRYSIDAKITNSTTGEYIEIDYLAALNRTLSINCDAKTITYDDGANARASLRLSSIRSEWLNLSAGANTLQYDETGATAVTVTIDAEGRNTF